MNTDIPRILLFAVLLGALLQPGCASHQGRLLAERAPGIRLHDGAARRVFVEIRNSAGADFRLHSPLAAALQRRGYTLAQQRDEAGYTLDVHLLEIVPGILEPAFPGATEDYGSSAPVLGVGIGSLSGRPGVGVSFGMGIPLYMDRGPFSSGRGGYAASAALEIEEAHEAVRNTQRTGLTVTAPGISEAEALPALEDRLAVRISEIFP